MFVQVLVKNGVSSNDSGIFVSPSSQFVKPLLLSPFDRPYGYMRSNWCSSFEIWPAVKLINLNQMAKLS